MPFKITPDPDFPSTTKPIFFHRLTTGNGYLSQWYWSAFTLDNETYATAEMLVRRDLDTAKL